MEAKIQSLISMTFEEKYRDALWTCIERYRVMNTCDNSEKGMKLDVFIEEFSMNLLNKAPLMKLNRWLGYIQACLIERGYTTVEAERDWTRPLFRPLDFPAVDIFDSD